MSLLAIRMWQSKLPICTVVLLPLLCLEYQLETHANVTTACSTREPSVVQVLAVVQTLYISDGVKLLPYWTKGEEILPGANLAIKEINDLPNLLSGYQLEVIPVRVPQVRV